MKQIDSGDETWAVNNYDNIFILENNKWVQIDGQLIQVTQGSAGVWGVSAVFNVFIRQGVTETNVKGSYWKVIQGDKVKR